MNDVNLTANDKDMLGSIADQQYPFVDYFERARVRKLTNMGLIEEAGVITLPGEKGRPYLRLTRAGKASIGTKVQRMSNDQLLKAVAKAVLDGLSYTHNDKMPAGSGGYTYGPVAGPEHSLGWGKDGTVAMLNELRKRGVI